MSAATARAFPNIALIKYWGKRDEGLVLPATGSLSMTLDILPTTTTVELGDGPGHDDFELNGSRVEGEPLRRVERFLDLVRELAGSDARAIVRSRNEAPTAAGLASSASGFAALATAASAAYGLDLDSRGLSRLARRGSGSASRSVITGTAIWHAGDDEGSFAEAIDAPDFRMVIVTVDGSRKSVPSRDAMRSSASTSPFYPAWVTSTEASLAEMAEACRRGDFTRVGELTEMNALRMHAVIQSNEPPVRYLTSASIAVFDAIARLRESGLESYGTADAGPNVVAIVRPDDAEALATALSEYGSVRVAGPGAGAELLGAEALR